MIREDSESAVTPAISVMLLVLLTAIIAIIMYAFIYGIPGGLEKSAFIAAEAGVLEINGTEYVAIQHRGGDESPERIGRRPWHPNRYQDDGCRGRAGAGGSRLSRHLEGRAGSLSL